MAMVQQQHVGTGIMGAGLNIDHGHSGSMHNRQQYGSSHNNEQDDMRDSRSVGARSDASAEHDNMVRPESLGLKSPLEQLTRKLSYNKQRQHPEKGQGRAATPMALLDGAHAAQQDHDRENMRGYNLDQRGKASAKDGQRKAAQQPLIDHSTSHGNSFLDVGTRPDSGDAGSLPSERTRIEPVRFERGEQAQQVANQLRRHGSDASALTDTHTEISDAHSQIINAFRGSYAETSGHSTGRRESSCSWTTGGGDTAYGGLDGDSSDTMDFAQAARSATSEVHSSGSRKPSHKSTSKAVHSDNNDENDQNEEIDAERARARASSWDSANGEAADALRRIPSLSRKMAGLRRNESAKRIQEAEGRESGMSATDPFIYASYESEHAGPRAQQLHASYRADPINSQGLLPAVDEEAGPDERDSVYAYPLTSSSEIEDQSAYGSRLHAGVSSYYFSGGNEAGPSTSRAKSQVAAVNYSRPWQRTAQPSYTQDHAPPLQGNEAGIVPNEFANEPQDYSGKNQPDELDKPIKPSTTPAITPDRRIHQYLEEKGNATFFNNVSGQEQEVLLLNNGQSSPSNTSHRAPALEQSNSLQSIQTYSSNGSSFLKQLSPSPAGFDQSSQQSTSRLNRSHGSVMASAIAKHRAQRAAAGLNTQGQYYVDPKTGKHYFVADTAGKGKGREQKDKNSGHHDAIVDVDGKKKPKERRKLQKKEAGWEVSKYRPPSVATALNMTMQNDGQQEHPDNSQRYPATSPDHNGWNSSGYLHELSDSDPVPSHWKPWTASPNASSQGSQPGTREGSPLQPLNLPSRQNPNLSADSSIEWIHIGSPSASPQQRKDRQQLPPSSSAMPMSSAPVPTLQTTPAIQQGGFDYPAGPLVTPQQSGHLDAVVSASQSGRMHRSGSLYSQYSYYGELPPSPSQSPHPGHAGQTSTRMSPNNSVRQQTAISPYVPPTASQFQPGYFPPYQNNSGWDMSHERSPSISSAEHSSIAHGQLGGQPLHRSDTTLTKVSKHASLQLLATTKHTNLTVPKSTSKKDQIDLSQLDPNHPLVSLHRGIDAHEQGELEQSARLFEHSANQGCGLGMLMYGLTLRHGWGCDSQPEQGFFYLQKAAESVVHDLDKVIAGDIQLSGQQIEEQSAKSELVLSIYELGQCYLRGWGIAKDKKVALQYFELAANLGDPDAQSELGFCYSTGKGCKKDLKKAAKYYRLAEKQGISTYGMQWIWKAKYDD